MFHSFQASCFIGLENCCKGGGEGGENTDISVKYIYWQRRGKYVFNQYHVLEISAQSLVPKEAKTEKWLLCRMHFKDQREEFERYLGQSIYLQHQHHRFWDFEHLC